jgi:hypothetical protein
MQYLFKLERGLTGLEIDDESASNASCRSKLGLPQLLRFAFAPNDQSE